MEEQMVSMRRWKNEQDWVGGTIPTLSLVLLVTKTSLLYLPYNISLK